MRKNQVGRKGIGGAYTEFEVKGLNLDRFINTVQKRGVDLYDVKKTAKNCIIVSVSLWKSQKFFAIAEELCYNIKKVREKGRTLPIVKLARSFGLIIGAVIFTLISVFYNDVIFSFSFSGSGSLYKREVQNYLYSNGVKPMVRFSDIDLERLEDGILADNPHLSFASCKKSGNRLVIELVLSQDKRPSLDDSIYSLTSDVDGVIESVKVYRGTALFSVGDSVKKGDVIVDGYAVVKEQTVKINVLAYCTLKVQKVFNYQTDRDGCEDFAVALALSELDEKEVITYSVQVSADANGYNYVVTTEYRHVIRAG